MEVHYRECCLQSFRRAIVRLDSASVHRQENATNLKEPAMELLTVWTDMMRSPVSHNGPFQSLL